MSIATLETHTVASAPVLGVTTRRVAWGLQLVAAAILAMTLPFKFTAAPETVALFEELGAGAAGRLGTAVLETIAVALLLTPRLAAVGAVLTAGLMSGAILSHVAILGIVWDGDASLFTMAVLAFAAAATVAVMRRRELPVVGPKLG